MLLTNCQLSFSVGAYTGYAHTHYSPAAPYSSISPTSCNTGSLAYCPLTLNTNVVGQAEYITISSTTPGVAGGTYQYAVGVTIYYVSDHGIWTLNGAKAIHGGTTAFNHWMTSNAANGIYNATVLYQASYPGLVLANNMSLPFGGIFDLNGAWTLTAGHKSHQFGFDADIDGITDPTAVTTFLAACTNKGATYTAQEGNLSLHCHWPN
jgi:hypothetical protein